MRDAVAAQALLHDLAGELGVAPELLAAIFEDTPVDFPVIFNATLPLGAHRLGMTGITLFGRVYLLDSARSLSPAELLILLRHEAEHVRQQRAGRAFYLRYLGGWLLGFGRELGKRPERRYGRTAGLRQGRIAGAWYRAYRMLPEEREAYAAGERARILLGRGAGG